LCARHGDDAPTGRQSRRNAAWPEAGRIGFELEARPGRPARAVTLAVRFGAVRLRKPQKAPIRKTLAKSR
jgi:hypothetical protein